MIKKFSYKNDIIEALQIELTEDCLEEIEQLLIYHNAIQFKFDIGSYSTRIDSIEQEKCIRIITSNNGRGYVLHKGYYIVVRAPSIISTFEERQFEEVYSKYQVEPSSIEKLEEGFATAVTPKNEEQPDPLTKQVGGDHYKGCAIQPVEFITANNLGFMEGSAIKYICRHEKKNGRQDIEKAIHYLELILKLKYKEVKP